MFGSGTYLRDGRNGAQQDPHPDSPYAHLYQEQKGSPFWNWLDLIGKYTANPPTNNTRALHGIYIYIYILCVCVCVCVCMYMRVLYGIMQW
eukprot:COSAG05_NODE_2340_length_3209_cov_18.437727_4_plen_91_part_00